GMADGKKKGSGSFGSGMGSGMGLPGALGQRRGATDEYKIELARRRFKSQMHSIMIGLEGIKGRAKQAQVADTGDGSSPPDDTVAPPPKMVEVGTKGILGLAKDPETIKYIKGISAKVGQIRDMMDNTNITDLDKLVADVRGPVAELERIC